MKMRFLKLLTIAALLATAAWPQAAENTRVQKMIQLKYVDTNSLANLLNAFVPSRSYRIDDATRTIAINAVQSEAKIIEDTIARLDVPPKDIELTAWFLSAYNDGPPGAAPPVELEKVVAQLRTAFAFKNYRLIDALILRVRSGKMAETSGTVAAGNAPPLSQFKIRSANVSAGEKGQVVRIDGLRAGLKVPVHSGNSVNYIETGINGTDIDIGEGQKVVVGKSSMEGPDKALIVVLTAKVL
jgi:hypothetical protein